MKAQIKAADAISLLSRSNLPTVITEGSDDYRIMRRIEQKLSDLSVDFLPVGGKLTVLEVWKNIPPARKGNVVALVDLDTWMFIGIPNEYQADDLYHTFGFSIENDVFIDAELLRLCDPDEIVDFKAEIDVISHWFAAQILKVRAGEAPDFKTHATTVLASNPMDTPLCEEGLALRRAIRNNYPQILRGKTLLQLLMRQLNRAGRHISFSYKQVYEIGATSKGDLFDELEKRLRGQFS